MFNSDLKKGVTELSELDRRKHSKNDISLSGLSESEIPCGRTRGVAVQRLSQRATRTECVL